MKDRIKEMIQSADLVLIGVGEEFDGERSLKQRPHYKEVREKLEATGQEWLIPSLNRYFTDHCDKDTCKIKHALSNLAALVNDKNYFVVSIATNDYVWDAGFKEDRVVAPCGGSLKKQCKNGGSCTDAPLFLREEEQADIIKYIEKLLAKDTHKSCECNQDVDVQEFFDLGVCPICDDNLILNNIYTEKYDERGYLDQWQKYTKWLQGTLNKKLCILELGVGMQCPSVIRFPFEKIGYFNQKADFIRINKNLYQLTEELKEKGISISENAVDWLASMW